MKDIKQYIKEMADSGIFEAIGDGVSIQDTNFKVLYQNKVHIGLIGDHIGEYCYKKYEKRDNICEGCPVAKSFKDGKIHKAERTAPTDKGTLYVDITSSPLMDSTGKIIAAIEIAKDITERKKIEEELKSSEEKYRLLFTGVQDAIVLVEAETRRIIDANDAALRLYGYSRKEILKLYGPDLSAEPEKSTVAIKKIAEQTNQYIDYHTRLHKKKDGTVFSVEISSGKLILHDKKIVSAVIRDVSERKQAEEELTEYRNNLEQMVEERTKELDKQKTALEQKNITLREVIGEIELQKNKITDNCLATINELVMPTLKEFKAKGNSDDKYIDLIIQNLQKITSPFASAITSRNLKLTPREIEVCNMIEKGFTNKDIANFLNLTIQSIEEYRKRIRKKLELTNKKVNLTSYLRNITE